VMSVEVSPGTISCCLSTTSGKILMRDDTVLRITGRVSCVRYHWQHRSSATRIDGRTSFITTECEPVGAAYPYRSSLMRSVEHLPAALSSIRSSCLTAPSTLYSDRWYFSAAQAPAWCRHLQIKFTWPTEAAANEMLSYSLIGHTTMSPRCLL